MAIEEIKKRLKSGNEEMCLISWGMGWSTELSGERKNFKLRLRV
jgi:hypothetical protein